MLTSVTVLVLALVIISFPRTANAECSFKGKMYKNNQSILTAQPCLNCTCSYGAVVCCLQVCPRIPSPPDGCKLVKEHGKCCPVTVCNTGFATDAVVASKISSSDKSLNDISTSEQQNGNHRSGHPNSYQSRMTSEAFIRTRRRKGRLGFVNDTDPGNRKIGQLPDQTVTATTMDGTLFVTSPFTKNLLPEVGNHFLNDISNDCYINGTLYAEGSALLTSASCYYCYCIRGKERCLRPKCHLSLDGCHPQYGHRYACCPTSYDCRSKTRESTTFTVERSRASNEIRKEGVTNVFPENQNYSFKISSLNKEKGLLSDRYDNNINSYSNKEMSTLFTETNKNETIPMSSGAKTQLYDIAVGYREKTLKTTPNLNISHLPNNGSSIQFVDDLGVAKKETSYNIFSDKDSETRERNSFYVSDKSNSNEVEKQINKHSIEGSKEFRVKRNTRKISSEGSSGKIPLEPPQKDFSIENLEIIPFVAEDAVFKPLYFNKQEDNKETVIRKAEEREEVSKTREEIPDLSAHSSTLFETTLRPIMSAERTPQDCFIDGQLYINGETFKKSDPCLMCQCFYGEELCQQQHCPSPPSSECIMERLDGFCCPRYTCETTQEVSQGLHSENKRFQAYDVRPWVAATGVPIPSSEGKNTHSTTKYSNESEKLKDVEDIITGTFLSISDAPAPPVLMFGSSGTSSQTKRHGTHITQISAQRRKSNEGTSSMKNLASVLLVVDGDSTILDSTVKSNSKPFSVDSLINKPNQENKTVITIGNPSSHSVIRNGMPDNVPSRFAELVTEETLDIKHNQSKSKTHIVSLEESSQLKPNGSNWEQNTNTSENSFLKSFQSERSDTISISNQPERLEHSSLSVNKQETDKKHSFDSISLESLKPLSPNREEFGSLESNIGLLGVSSHEYEGSTIEPPKREKPGSFPSQTNHPETIFKPIRHFSESHIFPQGTTEEANLGKIQQESPMKEWDGEVDTQSSMQTVMSNIPIRTNWGSLKVSGCNIFGMFYGVEQVIPELSEPCKNCVCRASGVECAVTC